MYGMRCLPRDKWLCTNLYFINRVGSFYQRDAGFTLSVTRHKHWFERSRQGLSCQYET
jgi:hypothetical protein